jgi:hypothetical protein
MSTMSTITVNLYHYLHSNCVYVTVTFSEDVSIKPSTVGKVSPKTHGSRRS